MLSQLTVVDWVALAVIAFMAIGGWARGLIASALSLVGLVAGAYAGSHLARRLLEGGAHSQWAAAASLLGAIGGAVVLQAAASV